VSGGGEAGVQGLAVVGADDVANLAQSVDELVEHTDDGGAVLGADVEPDRRTPARHPRHVAKAAGGEAQQRSMFLGTFARETHQRGRGEVRNVADHRDELIVALGAQCNDLGTERRDDGCHLREHGVVTVGARREHPDRPLEQVGLGAVESVEFRSRHRVPTDEPGVGGGRADGRLDTADVGDGAIRLGECPLDLVGSDQHRHRHERDLGPVVEADGVHDATVECCRCRRGVDVLAAHVPAPLPKGQRDRTTDQPEADHIGPAHRIEVSHGPRSYRWHPGPDPCSRRPPR
jgi:hypothetical protein